MAILIDTVPLSELTTFICIRKTEPPVKRKFKASCGTYLIYSVQGSKIVGTEIDLIFPAHKCSACEALKISARLLIESGK